MDTFNLILTRLFDGALYPFRGLHPLWGIGAVSLVAGIAMLWVYGKISNQKRIQQLKDKIKGHLLEIWIFRENLRVVLRAQWRTFGYATRYALCAVPAFVVLAVPVLLIMIQLQARYGWRPLQTGESAVVRVFYREPRPVESMDIALQAPDGVAVETPQLRIPETGEVDFRIRPRKAGLYALGVQAKGETGVPKSLCIAATGHAVSPLRASDWTRRLLYPIEPAMPEGPIDRIAVEHPAAEISLWGLRFHWLWPFFILSIATAFLFKGVLGVEV